MESIYVETTAIGHLVGRLHPDFAVAARQQETREWWAKAREHYSLKICQVALDKCGGGDPAVARGAAASDS